MLFASSPTPSNLQVGPLMVDDPEDSLNCHRRHEGRVLRDDFAAEGPAREGGNSREYEARAEAATAAW